MTLRLVTQHRLGRLALLLVLLLTLPLAAGCSGEQSGTTQQRPAGGTPAAQPGGQPAASAATQPATQAKTVDPATVATLMGVVELAGTPPAEQPVNMRSEAWCGHQHGQPPVEEKVRVKNGKLASALVWIKDGLAGFRFEPRKDPVVLDQAGCLFTPRIVAVQVGQPLKILNSDEILHNVHAKPALNRDRNLALPSKGSNRDITFDRPEVMIPVVCDVHPWMKAWIGVIAHPFFTVTGEDGSFHLTGLPPGDYTLAVWHEVLGAKELQVTLTPQQQLQLPPIVYGGP
jgi:plastocyanin